MVFYRNVASGMCRWVSPGVRQRQGQLAVKGLVQAAGRSNTALVWWQLGTLLMAALALMWLVIRNIWQQRFFNIFFICYKKKVIIASNSVFNT